MVLPGRAGWIWWTLLILSPLAYVGGALLLMRDPAVQYSVGRDQAASISQRLAADKGISTQGWTTYQMGVGKNSLQAYYRRKDSPVEGQLQQVVPANSVRTLQIFYPEEGESQDKRFFETDIGPEGEILGYEFNLNPSGGREEVGEQASRELAEAAFRQRAGLIPGLEIGETDFERQQSGDDLIRTFTWKGTPAEAPEITLTFQVDVQMGVVIAEQVEAEVDADFLPPQLGGQAAGQVILAILVGLTWILLGVFGLIRFIRRMRHKELSLKRTLTIGLVLGGVYVLIFWLNAPDLIGMQLKGSPWWFLWVGIGAGILTNLMAAIFLGLAWGSGEGDVREAFPGKLTSLDALMTGKVFSRNVSAAVVAGSLLGGWLVLANGVFHLIGGSSGATESLAVVAFIPLPGLSLLLSPLERAVPFAIVGLLLPLAFASRSFKSTRWRRFFLATSSLLACTGLATSSDFPMFGLIFAALVAASLLGLFWAFDFLTAAAALNAFFIASNAASFPIDFSLVWRAFILAGVIVVPLLAAQSYFALRGRRYREDEVRPLYARHVEERRALKAEVSAARQAQLRLAPQQVPSLPGLTIAASCQPAQEVGGDFYDFFPVGRHRLGILLAEGGGEGLPAALAVAYAKGLLMPMAGQASAAQVMDYLRHELKDLLAQTTRLGLLYALVDVASGTFSYARLGDYPRILVSRNGTSFQEATGQATLSEGTARASFEIQPSDRILLFTDGIAQALSMAEDSPEEWLQGFLGSRPEGSAEEILQAFLKALGNRVKQSRRQGLDDDLSSIVLQVSPTAIFGAGLVTPEEAVA